MKRLLLAGLIVSIAAVGTAQANTIAITYTWTGSELIQTGRIFRDGTPSSCAAPKAFPGTLGTTQQGYVLFPFVNTSASVACMTVAWSEDPGNNSFLSAYLSPYDPLNMAANYLGDSGSSAPSTPISFSFLVPGDAYFDILANTVSGIAAATGTSFSFTIDGSVAPGVIPEPASLLLLGTGLVGLGRAWRKRRT